MQKQIKCGHIQTQKSSYKLKKLKLEGEVFQWYKSYPKRVHRAEVIKRRTP